MQCRRIRSMGGEAEAATILRVAREAQHHPPPKRIPSPADINGEGWGVFVETYADGPGKSGNCQLTIFKVVLLQRLITPLGRKLPA